MSRPRKATTSGNKQATQSLPAHVPKPVINAETERPPQAVAGMSFHGEYYRGPLPPPEYLRQYEEMYPGATQKIIDAGIRQTDHRIDIESKAVTAQIWRGYLGVACGFILGLVGLIGGIYVAINGGTNAAVITGGILSTGSLASLVGVFIHGTKSQREERVSKAKQNP